MFPTNLISSMVSVSPKTLTFQTHPVTLAYRALLAKTNSASVSVFRGNPDIGVPDDPTEPVKDPFPALTVLFMVFGFIVIILVGYTYQLLFTLVAIESPPSIRLPTSTDEEDQHGAGITSTTESSGDTTATSGYLTSSIRSTLRHLRREGGFFSPWRGFLAYICMCIIIGLWNIVGVCLVRLVVPDISPEHLWVQTAISGIISAAGASRVALLWTYAKIAAPRQNSFWETNQRITWAHAVKTIPATLLAFVITQLPFLPLKTDTPNENPHFGIPDRGDMPSSGFLGLVISFIILISFLIGIPVNLVLTRIQVSVLPDDPTIIPCDKTFGVVHEDTESPESASPIKALTIKEAIKTLDWPLLKRAYLFALKGILIFAVIGFQFFCLWFLMALIVGSFSNH